MGPIIGTRAELGQISPFDIASGISLSSTTPRLGSNFTATLSTFVDPSNIPTTVWTVTISYTENNLVYSSFPTVVTGATFSAGIVASIPGTYAVKAVTTYSPTNPSVAPHAPTTFTATATVAPPTTATKAGGWGTNVTFSGGGHTAIQLSDAITTPNGPMGPNAAGMFQENIPVTQGAFDPIGSGAWGPPTYGGSWGFNNATSTLNDSVGFTASTAEWNALPVGGTIVSYTQHLRYTWQMTDPVQGQRTFTSPLNDLNITWTKTGASSWTAN